ncbi:MAG: glycosyltransferase family 4 protein, partial [Candidatus Omnitrophica bacterium]|nr:glycosyltransferase family 4 protein [Candidatus Omnitrophota bacterium]
SKKIKVLHIITQLDLGGAQKNALDIVSFLDKEKYTVYFVSSQKGLLAREALSIPRVNIVLLPSLKRPIDLIADAVSLFKLTSLFKKEAIDLVHTHSSKAGILGRWAAHFAGVRFIVHTVHGWSFNDRQHFLTKSLYIFLEKITARFTDKFVAVTKSDIQKGLAHKIGRKNKYALIPYGIESKYFLKPNVEKKKKKKELGLDEDTQLVGMVACFKPQKSPLDFVRVASLIIEKRPKTHFIMVGDGILRKSVERLIEKSRLKDNFILTGWRRDIAELMSCLDVLTLTSLWEGFPIVFLEGMYSKLPIVAYDVDGVREVINEGVNGFLVRPGDIDTMASRIEELLGNREFARTLGNNGFNYAMNNGCDTTRMLTDFDNLYANLAANSRPD